MRTKPGIWLARRRGRARPADWRGLRQAWRADGPERGFRPGRVRVTWDEEGLEFAIVFTGVGARNRARRLNEPTWELGDVAEVFLARRGRPGYLEIHVTPENQRLQLRWAAGGVSRLRTGRAQLGEFTFEGGGVVSTARRSRRGWMVRVHLARDLLGPRPLALGDRFVAAVCRYDWGNRPDPVYSSTANLRAADFHRRREWHQLRLCP